MTRDQYLQKKGEQEKQAKVHRKNCAQCRKPEVICYCSQIKPFDSFPTFAILIHKMESRRIIATGRIAHLSLSNSHLIEGLEFSENEDVNALINNPLNHCVVLSPGPTSLNLSECSEVEREAVFPKNKKPIVFVLDGTWAQARRMKRLSWNLRALPSICFTPASLSRFSVRHQPAEFCYSTIEAIHEVIKLLSPKSNYEGLLAPFYSMVSKQEEFVKYGGGRLKRV